LGFSNDKWETEVWGGLRRNDKVFLTLAHGDSEDWDGALDFDGPCPDIAGLPNTEGRALRYRFNVGRFFCECETAVGVEGTMRIAGQAFDLAAGALFLIAIQDGQPRVRQLRRVLTKILYTPSGLRRIVESDAETSSFFRQPEG